MFIHEYPKKAYDHIIVPEAFFPMNEKETFHELVDRLMQALRENGTLRINRIGWETSHTVRELEKRYEIEYNAMGLLIIRHKK